MINKQNIGQNKTGGGTLASTIIPSVIQTLNTPNQQTFTVSYGVESFDSVQYQTSDQPEFTDPSTFVVAGSTIDFTADGSAIDDYYFQARGLNDNGVVSGWSESQFIDVPIPVGVGNTFPQITEGDTTLNIAYQTNASGLKDVTLFYKEKGALEFIENGTFPNTGTLQLGGLINDTTYEVQLRHNPTNFDYVESFSSILEGTPSVQVVKLSTPFGLTFVQISQSEGTFIWTGVQFATNYNYYVNDILINGTASTNATIDISGFSIGTQIKLSVEATAVGYTTSDRSDYNYIVQDFAADVLTPEQFGAIPYYKPLDGRQFESFDFPLINYEPLDEAAFNALGTGLVYGDYIYGATKLNPVTNDGLGTSISGVFTTDDVGKTFVGLRNNLNPSIDDVTGYVDLFINSGIGARYATIIYQTLDYCLVDFTFNGGNAQTPQNQLNGKGYVFYDNTNALNQVAANWKISFDTIRLTPNLRSNYVLSTYVATEFRGFDLSDHDTKNFKIWTGTTAKARIKYDVEDYNGTLGTTGSKRYDVIQNIFTFNGYTAQCISHNVQWVCTHNRFSVATPHNVQATSGKIGGGGVCLLNNIDTLVEWDELANGYEVTDVDLFAVNPTNVQQSGSRTGDTLPTDDVDKFGIVAFIGGADFTYMGYNGGSTTGGTYYVYDDFSANNRPISKYKTTNIKFDCKFTTDFTGIYDSGDSQDPSTKTQLPSHCLEITSTDGQSNFWIPRVWGGNNRTMVLHIDKFIFTANTNRHNSIVEYWCPFYFNTESRLTDENRTISGKKAIVNWEIPQVGEVRQLSRDYFVGNNVAANTEYSKNPLPFENAVRTHINWNLIFDKREQLFSQDQRDYIVEYGRSVELQVGDEFKLLSWVVLDGDLSGLSKGDTVTGDTSGATATVERVEQLRYINRVILKGASASFDGDTSVTINASSFNLTSASTYDPNEIYRGIMKQRGDFGNTSVKTITDYEGYEWDTYGSDYALGIQTDVWNKNKQGYQFAYIILNKHLPIGLNQPTILGDAADPLLYVEFVTSKAAYLLDGQVTEGRLNYFGNTKYNTNYGWADLEARTRLTFKSSNLGGYNSIAGFDTEEWTYRDYEAAWVSYTRATVTWYLRNPPNWQSSLYRQQLSTNFNGSQMRPAGSTAYSNEVLAKYSKGYTAINVKLPRLLETEKASSSQQFDRTKVIYDANPSYVPQYAIDEEMLPPNETAPYIPAVRIYGTDAVSYYQNNQVNEYTNVEGTAVFDNDVNNAPDLPKTIRDILATLPS
jgi:hypothetical protein